MLDNLSMSENGIPPSYGILTGNVMMNHRMEKQIPS